jgi:cytochrome oxidase assembly protein ShyY1
MVFFGGIVGTTVYLGTWQTQRYYWKQDMIKERSHSLALEPMAIPEGEHTTLR